MTDLTYQPWLHPNPLTLSHSSLGTYEGCKRRFEFFKFYTLPEREDYGGDDANAGKAIHAGYQAWMATQNEDAAYYAMMREFNVMRNPAREAPRGLEACYATLEKMIQTVNLVEYEIAKVKCIDGIERPAVEVEFEIWLQGVEIAGRPVCFHGFIDLVLFSVITGMYSVLDIKTHHEDKNVDRTARFVLNSQMVPYGLAIKQIAHQDIAAFQTIYLDAFLDVLEPRCSIFRFQKTQEDLVEWFTSLYYTLKQIDEYVRRDHFPRTGHGCMFFRTPCQFLPICQQKDKATIQSMLLPFGINPQKPKPRNPWIRLVLPMNINV